MKIKIVKKARSSLLAAIDIWNQHKSRPCAGHLCSASINALKREICTDKDKNWPKIRDKYITAGTSKYFIPKTCKGAETRSATRKKALEMRISPSLTLENERELKDNPDIQRGNEYQLEAASVYSSITGYTVAPIGCLIGPLPAEGEFPDMPGTLSGTLDYIVLEDDIVVEIKCPRKFKKDWKQRYFAQPQIQMQLARCRKAHVVIYIPPTFNARGQIHIKELFVDHSWFRKICPSVETHLKYIRSKISEPNLVPPTVTDDISASEEYTGDPKLLDTPDETLLL